jgi:hypothetical protein
VNEQRLLVVVERGRQVPPVVVHQTDVVQRFAPPARSPTSRRIDSACS